LVNGKSYVGSSKCLAGRFSNYYSLAYIKKREHSSIIYSAILKHGHKNFSLDILEYCEPSQLIEREQFYLDLLKPEYNILKVAGSTLGFKHSEATKIRMSIINTGANHPLYGKTPNYETRVKIAVNLRHSLKIKNDNNYIEGIKRNIIKNTTITKIKFGVYVKIFDKSSKLIREFTSISSAARYLYISDRTIRTIRERGVSYDNYIYKFEDIKILIYGVNKELINMLDNKKKVSELYNISCTTLSRYIKSGKLYNNMYYFHVSNNKK
jgi:group I intron endonuclease